MSGVDSASVLTDSMSLDPARALDSLIEGHLAASTALPPMWHCVYFLERPAQSELGPDGHPRVGRPAPPKDGLRRMFAGGRVTTHRPLLLGIAASVTTTSSRPTLKDGRTGPLWFVTVSTQYEQDGSVAITEERDIVYRPAAEPSKDAALLGQRAAVDVAPVQGTGTDLDVDETLLFRFSALTYNAHRIHYDLDWAAREGYGGLVVHGPLQALMMAEHLRRSGVELVGSTFSYRLVSPMIGTQPLRVRDAGGDGCEVLDARGKVTASSVVVAPK